MKHKTLEDFTLPQFIQKITGQKSVPFGDGVIATEDTSIGYEIGDELRNPNSSHIEMGNDGVEIFINGSASYMELRKAHINVDLIQNATLKNGGCYLYSNLRGCDGDRVYFQGNSCISLNGDIISRTRQYGIEEIEIATATLDLVSIRSYRNSLVNKCNQAMNECTPYPRVPVDFSLSEIEDIYIPTHIPLIWDYHTPEQEIMLGISCWLWDYLRRSGQGGFFLPLNGGIDTSSISVLVYSMCQMVIKAVERGDEQALHDIRRVVGESDYVPIEPKELCSRIFVTCFMGSESAPEENKSRAKKLAQQIGSYHMSVLIDSAVTAIIGIFSTVTGVIPKFRSRGGSIRENLALQNVQSRVKMVISYLFAQLMLWARNRAGGLLVLGSTNIDDCLRGFITKYDCSSADINPIGSISKIDLKYFLLYAKNEHNFTSLEGIINELEPETLPPPSTNHRIYSEEADMGMTYEELSQYGKLRMTERCGPHSMFNKLTHSWRNKASPDETAKKVKLFFRFYAINRHKMTVLTPACHVESYNPDDNRFDHRPFLYNSSWRWQFRTIDNALRKIDMKIRNDEDSKKKGSSHHAKDRKGYDKDCIGGSSGSGKVNTGVPKNEGGSSSSNSNGGKKTGVVVPVPEILSF
nr:glutamine-dependent NAD(+) synthetase-like isoform X2 [Lepeophtheirus salmonis]